MKKHLLFIFALISAGFAGAQTLSPTVIASSGAYSSVGGVSLSYTVGELAAIQTLTSSGGNTILTQGFQQPNDIVNGLLDVEKGPDGSFSVYPVPAVATIWFGYEFNEAGKTEVSLYDVLGQKLGYNFSEAYQTGKLVHSFDCTPYAAGNYMLSVKFTTASGQETILTKKIQILTN